MVLVKKILQKIGVEVIHANNGIEAIELCRSENPDLILMDIQMPVMDGYDATREIRTEGFTMPIIALTAGVVKGEKQRCLDAGMDDYLSKPLNQDKLKSMVLSYLQEKID